VASLVPLGVVLALAAALSPASAQPARFTLGAIRWDAWLGGVVTNEVTLALTPPQYHFRLPWFAQVADTGEVTIKGGTQEIMDREIAYAAAGGLDYWAFVVYPQGDPMSRGLELYLSSAQRQRLRFCLILHNNLGVPEAAWPAERDRVVKLLQEPGYMTVCEGRPLVYMFTPPHPGRLAELQAAVTAAGLKPYYVYMGWNPPQDWETAQTLGFDAISAYACGGQGTYAQLTERVERVMWKAAGDPGIPLVPLATTGWDRRPRIDRPPQQEHGLGRDGDA
jgi:hypothetical protein